MHLVLEFNQSQWKHKKNGDKDGKALYKVMINAVYGKAVEIIDVRNLSNKSDYLKWIPQPSYMSHIIFDNDLGVIHKSKVTLSLN